MSKQGLLLASGGPEAVADPAPRTDEAIDYRHGAQIEHAPSPEPVAVMLLSEKCPLETLIARLKHHYADPVPVLCDFLTKTVPYNSEWHRIEREAQRAVEALIALGSIAGLEYLIRHVSLLCWDRSDPLANVMRPHRAAFSAAAVNAWGELTWGARATLILLFAEHHISQDPIVDLLCATDGSTLSHADRKKFVDALEFAGCPRAVLALHKLLDQAIADASSAPSVAATQLVLRITSAFAATQSGPTLEAYRRAAQLGIRLETRAFGRRARQAAAAPSVPPEVMAFIGENPGCTRADIHARLAIPLWKLERHLYFLHKSGLLWVKTGTKPGCGRKHRLFYAAGDTDHA